MGSMRYRNSAATQHRNNKQCFMDTRICSDFTDLIHRSPPVRCIAIPLCQRRPLVVVVVAIVLRLQRRHDDHPDEDQCEAPQHDARDNKVDSVRTLMRRRFFDPAVAHVRSLRIEAVVVRQRHRDIQVRVHLRE